MIVQKMSDQTPENSISISERGPSPSGDANPLVGAPDVTSSDGLREQAKSIVIETPEWLQTYRKNQTEKLQRKMDQQSAKETVVIGRGNSTWQKGGPSPNPAGRPPGIAERKAKVHELMLDKAHAIIDVMVVKALGGDPSAAAVVLSRVLPVLRAQSEKVTFVLNADASVSKQIEQVLSSIALGQVAPDIGKKIIEAVQVLGNVRAMEDLEQRIAALEGRGILEGGEA